MRKKIVKRREHHKSLSDELASGLFDRFKGALKKHRKWVKGQNRRAEKERDKKKYGSKTADTYEKDQKKKKDKKTDEEYDEWRKKNVGYKFGDVTKSAIKKFKNMFKKADIDKDGKVTKDELEAFAGL